jgi:hypothetical protein
MTFAGRIAKKQVEVIFKDSSQFRILLKAQICHRTVTGLTGLVWNSCVGG